MYFINPSQEPDRSKIVEEYHTIRNWNLKLNQSNYRREVRDSRRWEYYWKLSVGLRTPREEACQHFSEVNKLLSEPRLFTRTTKIYKLLRKFGGHIYPNMEGMEDHINGVREPFHGKVWKKYANGKFLRRLSLGQVRRKCKQNPSFILRTNPKYVLKYYLFKQNNGSIQCYW